MKRSRKYALLALLSVASATFAVAQTEMPQPSATQGTQPSETQKTAKAKHDQMMKECMQKEMANNSSMSKDAAKKACANELKSQSSTHHY